MRCIVCFISVLACTFTVTYAEETREQVADQTTLKSIVITPELVQAHSDFQLARLHLQQYRHVTLPQQRRQLNENIKLADQEIKLLKRRLRNYRPFLQVDEFSPVRTAADSHRLALTAAQSQSRQLRDARINQMRFTRQNYQLLQLELLKAATQLAEVQRASVAD